MTSSYTTNKHLEQPAHGDYADTWQIPVNGNMGEIDAALGGTTLLSTTSGSHTLTVSEYQSAFLSISGTLTGSVTYTIPSGVGGQWTFDTTAVVLGGFTVTLASGGGGSVVLPGGQTGLVFTNGTFVKLSVSGSGGGGTPGGSDTQVQYNSSGSFAGTSAITVAGSVATINTLFLTNSLLPANGGTGVSTLPANSVIVGAGTSPVTGVAPGTAGNGLISNGTVWASAAIPPGLWNAGTVTTLAAGLTLSTGTLTPQWSAGTITAIGSGITLTSGTISAAVAGVGTVVAGAGLTGGTITSSGTISQATISAGSISGNAGTVAAVPTAVAIGTNLTLTSAGTLNAITQPQQWNAGTITTVGAGLAVASNTLTGVGITTYGAVGSVGFFVNTSTAVIAQGATVIGASLAPTSLSVGSTGGLSVGTPAPSGTWRNMGADVLQSNYDAAGGLAASVFSRVS